MGDDVSAFDADVVVLHFEHLERAVVDEHAGDALGADEADGVLADALLPDADLASTGFTSRTSSDVLRVSSVRIIFSPDSDIMFEAIFSCLQQLLAIRLFTACMPLSEMALSAMLMVSYWLIREAYLSQLRVLAQSRYGIQAELH